MKVAVWASVHKAHRESDSEQIGKRSSSNIGLLVQGEGGTSSNTARARRDGSQTHLTIVR